MKVLLDECLPRQLKRHLTGHEVRTVPERGWAGVKNGALLRLAEAEFEVFVTMDGNLEHQQNLGSTPLAIVLLVARDNTLQSLLPLVPDLLTVLLVGLAPGTVIRVGE